jgi:hypothetical protein
MKSNYIYKRPEGALYKVSIRKWNKSFVVNRGRWPFILAEVYLSENKATVHYVPSKIGLLLFTLLAPFIYITGLFIEGHKGAVDAIKDVYFCKSRGAFTTDKIYKSSRYWYKLLSIINTSDE